MTILTVLRFPDERLRKKAVDVTDINQATNIIVEDMLETMYEENGVGLAATQVDIHQRIVVMDVSENKDQPLVLINPEIMRLSEHQEAGWEACLSLPGMRGYITRSASITYRALNILGEHVEKTVYNFHARIIQHEIDHLNGILYPQRLDDFSAFGFEDSLPDFQQSNR